MKEKQNRWVQKMGMAFAALFCMAVLALLPYREVLANVQGTVTASSAYIRASADVNSASLASVLSGNKVEIIEEVTGADNQKWYKVVIDADSTGYIRADLIQKGEGTVPTGTTATTTTTTPSDTPSTSSPNTNVTINTTGVVDVQPVSASVTNDQVRVRADSSTNADIVTTVKKNVVLTVLGTKAGSGNDTWYYVSFAVNNADVTGFIRSDFVTLNGDLTPPEETPAEEVPETPTEPVETPTQSSKTYETMEIDGVWYLLDNSAGQQYQISKLFSASDQNATELDNAQKKIKRQNGILIFLCVLLVVLVLGITVLILKLRDMGEDDGFDLSFRRPSGSGGGTRPSGTRATNGRPAGTRSQSGSRPTGQGSRPAGSRPVSQGSNGAARPSGSSSGGARPAQGNSGSHPAGASAGSRPAGQGSRPAGSRPVGQGGNPVSQAAVSRATEEKLERQAQADVEARNIEKNMANNQSRQSKNFLSDDDEFEFEFLNWDGDEET
ncbi:MAG: SH3 domain-containing protein [Lachnospiraceae bacterium]|nr:SH3 domain-containing protein [Lachnospiraceae bacterium]